MNCQPPAHPGEIAAALLTGAAFLVFDGLLHEKLPFIVGCAIFWTVFLLLRLRADPGARIAWGIRLGGLRASSILCLLFFACASSGLLGYRFLAGWRPLPWTAIPVFALYPLWAFFQEFLVQSLVTGNLDRLGLSWTAIIGVAAALFGLVHLPDWPLVALTAGGGIVWTSIFLRTRNIFPLALTHGWLGALAYYWILERDPWKEIFPGG